MMMPTNAYTSSSMPEEHQRQQRAERRERQPGQDRERVDEALVQDAEHDVDHEDREDEQHEQSLLRAPEHLRVPEKRAGDRRRQDRRARSFSTRPSPSPSETPGARLNEIVTVGSWPEWFTVIGPTRVVELATELERHELARASSARTACRARSRSCLVLGQQLHDDPVLVRRGVDRGHLPLAVRVVQRVLDLLAVTPSWPRRARGRCRR